MMNRVKEYGQFCCLHFSRTQRLTLKGSKHEVSKVASIFTSLVAKATLFPRPDKGETTSRVTQ